jgi:hypothetical protein
VTPSVREFRKLKIDPNSESLLPIVLDVFRKEASPSVRLEVVEYLNWVVEEYGFRDNTQVVRVFCRYLQNSIFMPCDSVEEEVDNHKKHWFLGAKLNVTSFV